MNIKNANADKNGIKLAKVESGKHTFLGFHSSAEGINETTHKIVTLHYVDEKGQPLELRYFPKKSNLFTVLNVKKQALSMGYVEMLAHIINNQQKVYNEGSTVDDRFIGALLGQPDASLMLSNEQMKDLLSLIPDETLALKAHQYIVKKQEAEKEKQKREQAEKKRSKEDLEAIKANLGE